VRAEQQAFDINNLSLSPNETCQLHQKIRKAHFDLHKSK
jgi:hypothetical protein